MQAKLKISAAVLGTLLCAMAPAITHAESQQEWFQKRKQMIDGYMPGYMFEAFSAVPKKSDAETSRTDTKTATGYVGASKEGSGGSARIGNPRNYFNGFSPYASDPQYSAP
jgi:hypothetical protein